MAYFSEIFVPKNNWNRTTTVKIIVDGWVVSFFFSDTVYAWKYLYAPLVSSSSSRQQAGRQAERQPDGQTATRTDVERKTLEVGAGPKWVYDCTSTTSARSVFVERSVWRKFVHAELNTSYCIWIVEEDRAPAQHVAAEIAVSWIKRRIYRIKEMLNVKYDFASVPVLDLADIVMSIALNFYVLNRPSHFLF